MGRTSRGRRRGPPNLRPVERIELSGDHTARRVVLAAAFLALGVILIAYTVMRMLLPESEWVYIEADSSAEMNCSSEFVFLYHLNGEGFAARTEQRNVSELYTQLCVNAFSVFHNQLEVEGVNNLYAINRAPNEELTVDSALYEAFSVMERSGSRLLYLGPVYERYAGTFHCGEDSQLADFDPWSSADVAKEYLAYTEFANDPEAVRLELLGDNRVRLSVSREYLDYARQEGIECFIDFAWMRNAFIADYLARELTARGYGRGALTSYDGFARCMDDSGEEYSLHLYDRQGQSVYSAAEMHYQGPMSIVNLRDYPVNDLDAGRFYRTDTGEMRTPYVDPSDGMSRNAVPSLTCYAAGKGCGEILLEAAPAYIAEEFRKDVLAQLALEGIESIYCENGVIYPSDSQVELTQLYEDENVRYSIAH